MSAVVSAVGDRSGSVRKPSARLRATLAAGLAALALGGSWALWPMARGYALFHGHAALEASIQGGVRLPTTAARCVNCHDGGEQGGPRRIARLDAATLGAARAPRGGAAVTFDADGFCRVLREGVDPALVLVDRLMPRFTISDADCLALWTYASSR